MLGILDWGIGGISIYKLLKERDPGVQVAYFSDTGATPYGKMRRRELAARLDKVIGFLKPKGVTHLVIGCNAASTAIGDLADHDIPIEGVIDAAVATSARAKPARLAVLGGRRTIISGIYRRAFAGQGIDVVQRVAQPLSGMIESGDISSETLRSEARRILAPVRNSSHILLACTHYPAITNLLKEYVSPNTRFIDPADAVARCIARWKIKSAGADVFYTTGSPLQMKRSAGLAFGVAIDEVLKVRV